MGAVEPTGMGAFSGSAPPPPDPQQTPAPAPRIGAGPYQYYIESLSIEATTDDLVARLNVIGGAGWQLLFLGGIHGATDSRNAWFIGDSTATVPPPP